jgi:hypothetical protein
MINIYISKITGGYKLKTYGIKSGLPEIMKYYDYSLTQAIQQHRKTYRLQRKHLNKIYC